MQRRSATRPEDAGTRESLARALFDQRRRDEVMELAVRPSSLCSRTRIALLSDSFR